MNSTLLLTAFSGSQQGPTLLGVDVVWASTMLVAVGIFAVMVAIYGALTVRDPMAKRVKALNDRREQLKAGITASTAKRRARLVRKNHTADKMRTFLGKLQVLQDSQIKEVQQKLAQAGIRSKDLAVAVIFGRLVLPIVFGGIAALLIYWVDMWPDLTPFKRSAATMAMLILGYKAPDLFIQNKRLESVKGVVTTMIQTEKYGTPLASALRVLSAEFRNERMMRAEEKAARLPAIMTVPLILFILPVLFIVILGPAACSLSDAMSGGSLGGGKP